MLSNLKIDNIAIIENADICFEKGLNVLSGETGAGKSIIIDALSAVLGERTSRELIRTGADKATVVAVFDEISDNVSTVLSDMGIPLSDDKSLIISRTINADGRNICRINQSPATTSMLRTVGKELISIHGQHDSQNLLNPEYHYRYLDSLGELDELYGDYIEKYTEYSALYRRYKTLSSNEEEKQKRIELLRYQIDEISAAEIRVGEYNELCEKRSLFRNSEKVMKGLQNALSVLNDSDDSTGVINLLFDASKELERSANYYEPVRDIYTSLLDLTYSLSEKKSDIENAVYECEFNPAELSQIEDRISLIHSLKDKYGEDEEEILNYLSEASKELDSLTDQDMSKDKIERELEAKKDLLLLSAEKLSDARKHAASVFEVRVKHELSFLDMPNVEIKTSFTHCKLNPTGSDIIEFLISPNPGEALKPLAKIASGGELSRILLAIQNVLADVKNNVATMIFDEIDTGVSGSAAEKIAISLSRVSERYQVICITHSAQVAAYADCHFLIRKEVLNNKTYTNVTPLDNTGRIREIARIIGGVNITELQLQSAKEMLENTGKMV